MPTFTWPVEIGLVTKAFEEHHKSPDAGKLLRVATSCVDELHYLEDLDLVIEHTREAPVPHHLGVVDFAHVRWALSTCITAVDLCAAGLARALGGHTEFNEVDLGDFAKRTKRGKLYRKRMPPGARAWLRAAIGDPRYARLIKARHALIHSWVHAHYTLVIGDRPAKRFDLTEAKIPVRDLIVDAREFATAHVVALIAQLPELSKEHSQMKPPPVDNATGRFVLLGMIGALAIGALAIGAALAVRDNKPPLRDYDAPVSGVGH